MDYKIIPLDAGSEGIKDPFVQNIEQLTEKNDNYRKVIFTGDKIQLVLMSLEPGVEIGREIHSEVDQFFRIESGKAQIIVEKDGKSQEFEASAGFGIVIPRGTYHNIRNISKVSLKLYTIYSPPNHPPNKIEKQKVVES